MGINEPIKIDLKTIRNCAIAFAVLLGGLFSFGFYEQLRRKAERNATAERQEKATKERNEKIKKRLAVFDKDSNPNQQPSELFEAIVIEVRKGEVGICQKALPAIKRLDPPLRNQLYKECSSNLVRVLDRDPSSHHLLITDGEIDAAHLRLIHNIVRDPKQYGVNSTHVSECLKLLQNRIQDKQTQKVLLGMVTSGQLRDPANISQGFDLLIAAKSPEMITALRQQVSSAKSRGRFPSPKKKYYQFRNELGCKQEIESMVEERFAKHERVLRVFAIVESRRALLADAEAKNMPDAVDYKTETIDFLIENFREEFGKLLSDSKPDSPSISLISMPINTGQGLSMPVFGERGGPKKKYFSAKDIPTSNRSMKAAMFDQIACQISEESKPVVQPRKLSASDKLDELLAGSRNLLNSPASRSFPLRDGKRSAVRHIVDVFQMVDASDFGLKLLFRGLNVQNSEISLKSAERLSKLLPAEEFPGRFFQYLATRSQYSMSEVDRYIGFVRNHCKEVPGIVAKAIEDDLSREGGRPESMSWIKKYIGLKVLAVIGSKDELSTVEKFVNDSDSFRHTVTTRESGKAAKESSEVILFRELAKETADEIAG